MASLNKATLIGKLGRDPEFRTTQNGSKVCSMSVATSESWKDKATGEKREKTDWHRVTIWNTHLITLAEHLTKGATVYIEGQIETREYEKDGSKRYVTEIVLPMYRGEIKILSTPAQADAPDSPPAQRSHPAQPAKTTAMDDDIQF